MKKFYICLFVIGVFFLVDNLPVNAQLPIPEGRRIREIVDDKYPDGRLLVGGTTGSWAFGEKNGKVMDREFSYVTPENDFKQSVVRGDPDAWNWSRADAWIDHIHENNQVLRIHGPISPQCSQWAKNDNRTAEELSAELDTFMTALCKRYNDVEGIEYLDVVNEIALSDGSWHHPKDGTDQWENPWLKIGQDTDPNKTPLYVKQAFEIANKYAPDLKQIINNHCHPGTPGMEKVKETILYLKDRGYRVDGLGWQAHVEVGWATESNLQELRDVIDWCVQHNLEFHVTEFDAWIFDRQNKTLEDQAYTYRAIMDVLLRKYKEHENLVIGWNTWHISDAHGWKTDRIPSLFDEEFEPKPAYYAFQMSLETAGDYSATHKVSFQVKNKHTGEPVGDCNVTFNSRTKTTSADGTVAFEKVHPDYYSLEISKPSFSTYNKKWVGIYSDTTFSFELEHEEYNATIKTRNAQSGEAISAVNITLDSAITKTTNYEGTTSVPLMYGKHKIILKKKGYKSLNTEFMVESDTTLVFNLEQTHGDIKFYVKANNQPVYDAMVAFNEDTAYTGSLGIATFDYLPLDKTYGYAIKKENYKTVEDSITLTSDTTINLQMSESIADVEFEILNQESDPLEEVLVVMDQDSMYTNSDGKTTFQDIQVDKKYSYTIVEEGFVQHEDSLLVERDTTLSVTLNPTHVNNLSNEDYLRIYPVPADRFLNIKTEFPSVLIEIVDINGKSRKYRRVEGFSHQLNIGDLPAGIYFLKVKGKNKSNAASRIFLVE